MTRRFRAALAACAILCAPLAACGARPAEPAPAVTPAQVAARAMLTAETAFNVAATAELDAKGTGLLTGEKAERADQMRRDAYKVLLGLRAVYATGQAPDLASLLLLTNQLLVLAGQQPAQVPIPNVATL